MNQHVLLQKRKADTQERKTQELQNENLSILKWLCHEVFLNFFISLNQPIWAPNKQAKMVFLKNSFLRRYSNFKFKKFISAKSQIF